MSIALTSLFFTEGNESINKIYADTENFQHYYKPFISKNQSSYFCKTETHGPCVFTIITKNEVY
jgi:hypothetical protein